MRSCDSLIRISAGREARVAQRDGVHVDEHAAVAARGQLGGRAGDAGRAQVLDALDQVLAANSSRQHSTSSFSMNGSPTCTDGRLAAFPPASPNVALASTDAPPTPSGPVREPNSTTLLPAPLAAADLQVVVPHEPDAQRVDQRVARVAGVEGELAADVRQAEAVAVERDAGDDAGQHAGGVMRVGGAEPQRVHDRDRPGAHREDVAHDAADAGRRALVRLDERRVVVALDLEGDRVALADVHHARVRADARQQVPAPGRRWARGCAGAPWTTCTSSARST